MLRGSGRFPRTRPCPPVSATAEEAAGVASQTKTTWHALHRLIISLGDRMTRHKTAGKLPKGEIHSGRVRVQDSAKGSAPANLVLPKATKAPKSPLDAKK
jgi:hypothetical protein